MSELCSAVWHCCVAWQQLAWKLRVITAVVSSVQGRQGRRHLSFPPTVPAGIHEVTTCGMLEHCSPPSSAGQFFLPNPRNNLPQPVPVPRHRQHPSRKVLGRCLAGPNLWHAPCCRQAPADSGMLNDGGCKRGLVAASRPCCPPTPAVARPRSQALMTRLAPLLALLACLPASHAAHVGVSL